MTKLKKTQNVAEILRTQKLKLLQDSKPRIVKKIKSNSDKPKNSNCEPTKKL